MFPECQYRNDLPVWSKTTHFYEKYTKIVSNPMKYNADTLLFLLSFTKCQREKNIGRTFFVSAGAQKGRETVGSGTTLPQYLPNPKNEFPRKSIFT